MGNLSNISSAIGNHYLAAALGRYRGCQLLPGKLRNLTSHLAEIRDPQGEACQAQQLEVCIDELCIHSKKVTLAVSRDGVSPGITPFGNFGMASFATPRIHSNGCIGTGFLACAPEDN